MKQTNFNHAFSFSVEAISKEESAEDVTAATLRETIMKLVASMTDSELIASADAFDSFEVEGAPEDDYPKLLVSPVKESVAWSCQCGHKTLTGGALSAMLVKKSSPSAIAPCYKCKTGLIPKR